MDETKIQQILETVIRIDERLGNLSKRVDKLETWTEKHEEGNKAKSWQLWFAVISITIGGLAGWIFAILKG